MNKIKKTSTVDEKYLSSNKSNDSRDTNIRGATVQSSNSSGSNISSQKPVSPLEKQSKMATKEISYDFEINQTSKRGHIIMNLVETEASYINQLIFLLQAYGGKLKEAISQHLVENHVWDVILYQIPEIIFFHECFYYNIKSKVVNFDENLTTLGDVFIEHFQKRFLPSSYLRFLENYTVAKQYTDALNTVKILKNVANDHPQKLKIADILITPVQRIPRYLLIIKDLISKTPQNHADLALLKEAEKIVSKVASEVNSFNNNTVTFQSANYENEYYQIVQTVLLNCKQLSETNRTFINWFNVDFITIDDNGKIDIKNSTFLFLFNNALIFAMPYQIDIPFIYDKPENFKELALKHRAYHCFKFVDFNNAKIIEYTGGGGGKKKDNTINMIDILAEINMNNKCQINNTNKNLKFDKNTVLVMMNKPPKSNFPKIVKDTLHKNSNFLTMFDHSEIGDEYSKILLKDIFEVKSLKHPLKNIATILTVNEKCNCVILVPGPSFLTSITEEDRPFSHNNNDTDTQSFCNENNPICKENGSNYIINKNKDLSKDEANDIYSCEECIIINANKSKCKDVLEDQTVWLESSAWIGSNSGFLYVVPSTKNILKSDIIYKINTGAPIRVIKYISGSVIIGQENGHIIIFKHTLHKWNLKDWEKISVLKSSQPITNIELFSRNLICLVSEKTVLLLDKSYDITSSFQIKNIKDKDKISFISGKGAYFWISTIMSTSIFCYDVNEPHQRISVIDVRNDIAKFLSDKENGDAISLHKIKGLRITCINETEKYVCIGTSSGMILVIVKLLDQNNCLVLPMRTTVLPNGHVSPVRFINIILLPKISKNRSEINKDDAESPISKRMIQNKMENFLIVSGGEGHHNYSKSMLPPEKDITQQGLKDNVCTLLIWSIVS
ncbi:hypothetical protein HZS_847 [Henneguya salminicola]|nr:hypothetical protein HZS_847 [Henneguya salminicola]